MTWREYRVTVTVLILTALLVAGPWLNHDRVICIPSDSYVRVERGGFDCCRQKAIDFAARPISQVRASASDDDCGPCVDVRFPKEAAHLARCLSAVKTIHSTYGPILAGMILQLLGGGDQTSRQQIPLYPLAGNSFSTIHLSTVIRC